MNGTVLVVDDEERIRSSLRGILSDEGFRVVDTGNAPSVMEIIAREKPSVVLLDVWMPGLDGIELLRRIKSEEPGDSCHHDFRSREYPECRRGDPVGRRGLHREAFFGQRPADLDRARPQRRSRSARGRPAMLRPRHTPRPHVLVSRRDPSAPCANQLVIGRAGASLGTQDRRDICIRHRSERGSSFRLWPTSPLFRRCSKT